MGCRESHVREEEQSEPGAVFKARAKLVFAGEEINAKTGGS